MCDRRLPAGSCSHRPRWNDFRSWRGLSRTLGPALPSIHHSLSSLFAATDNGRLKLAATNLEIAITAWIPANVEDEGAITIPARLLTEFIASLPPVDVALTVAPRSRQAQIVAARNDATISGMDADDFPPIPTVESGVIGKISSSVLKDAITHVAFAAATEESRPVLTGIKVDLKEDSFTFVAADGFRLAVYEGKLAEAVSEDVSFIMPARAFQEVNRLIGSDDTTIEFTVTPSKSQALFRLENVELVSQLIQGTFPNYSQLIPEGHDTRAVVDQTAFLSATRTASIFARDGSGIVRLNVLPAENGSGGKLSISSRAEELGDNQGEIDASVEGDESKIAFNSKYLSEVLDVLGSGEIALETTTSSSPGVIRPLSKEGYIHVVMPMFVQW